MRCGPPSTWRKTSQVASDATWRDETGIEFAKIKLWHDQDKLGPAPFSLAVWAGVKGNIGRAAACYCYCYCILGETGCLSAVWKIGSSSVAVLSLTCGLLVQMFGELAGLGGCDSCKYWVAGLLGGTVANIENIFHMWPVPPM